MSWLRPVIDFAHMHATSDGAFTDSEAFASVLESADAVLDPARPFHIHFSDIAYANRNETKHLPYGEGTLRAEPLRDALARFDRPATIISESPDEASSQAIRAVLLRAAPELARGSQVLTRRRAATENEHDVRPVRHRRRHDHVHRRRGLDRPDPSSG